MLHSKGLHENSWENVLKDALHAVRSLLCTATNATPHERMFSFQRRSTCGKSLPHWLLVPGPVLLRRHVRQSKSAPLRYEVTLLQANPSFAHVQLRDGRETTVSVRDLAPLPEASLLPFQDTHVEGQVQNNPIDASPDRTFEVPASVGEAEDGLRFSHSGPSESEVTQAELESQNQPTPAPRRSSRVTRAPDRFGEWVDVNI